MTGLFARLLGKTKTAPTETDPTGPITTEIRNPEQGVNWPVGVPARAEPPDVVQAQQDTTMTPGSRGGGFTEPADGSPFPPVADNRNFQNDVIATPYKQTPRNAPYTVDTDAPLTGPGASPYMQAQSKDWQAQPLYRYSEVGNNRGQNLSPRLDGNRTVPNTVVADIAMDGNVGLVNPSFTISMNDTTPGYLSNSYVTTAGAGTQNAPGVPDIPNNIVVSNDDLPSLGLNLGIENG